MKRGREEEVKNRRELGGYKERRGRKEGRWVGIKRGREGEKGEGWV